MDGPLQSEVSLVARGRRLWGPSSYALTGNGLDLGQGRVVPYIDIIGISSKLESRPRLHHAQITIHTRRGRHVIPSRLSVPSHNFYDELMRQVTRAHEKLHTLRTPGEPRSPYSDMPAEVRDIVRRANQAEPGRKAHVFRGRMHKGSTWPRHLTANLVVAIAVASVIVALTASDGIVGAAVALGTLALLIGLRSLLTRQTPRGREWLCIHPRGLAMVGNHQTGELSWDDVEGTSIRGTGIVQPAAGGGSSKLVIRTLSGTNIGVPDFYDTPLATIQQLASQHLAAATDE